MKIDKKSIGQLVRLAKGGSHIARTLHGDFIIGIPASLENWSDYIDESVAPSNWYHDVVYFHADAEIYGTIVCDGALDKYVTVNFAKVLMPETVFAGEKTPAGLYWISGECLDVVPLP